MTGIIQKEIIKIGKEKGFIEIVDLKRFYSKNIQLEMNKLVIRGFFEAGIDDGIKITWKYKGL